MDGQRFDAVFVDWPPPSWMIGSDIHKDLVGAYELLEATDGSKVSAARYRLRDDDDYQRLVRVKAMKAAVKEIKRKIH